MGKIGDTEERDVRMGVGGWTWGGDRVDAVGMIGEAKLSPGRSGRRRRTGRERGSASVERGRWWL